MVSPTPPKLEPAALLVVVSKIAKPPSEIAATSVLYIEALRVLEKDEVNDSLVAFKRFRDACETPVETATLHQEHFRMSKCMKVASWQNCSPCGDAG